MELPFAKPKLNDIPASALRQVDDVTDQLIVGEIYTMANYSGCGPGASVFFVRITYSVYPIVDHTWKISGNAVSWDTTTYLGGICVWPGVVGLTCDVTDDHGNVVTFEWS